jgi:peptidyl-prolyl cis-trans isomerase SurA
MIKIKKLFLLILVLFLSAETNAGIKDSLFVSVENKAITNLDINNEVKTILIITGKTFTSDQKDKLQSLAVQSIVRRSIKKIEIEKYEGLNFNEEELKSELVRYASNLKVNVDSFKNIFEQNNIKFSRIVDQLKTELLWNSLIFQIYRDRLTVNNAEVDEQLKLAKKKNYTEDYLVSEIIIKTPEKEYIESEINNLINQIKTNGFEDAAINLSIAETALKGGNLGWINENVISKNFKDKIIKTKVGDISEPIFLQGAILIFKVRDKRRIVQEINIERTKKNIINAEKTKILRMYSLSHYEKVKKSVSIKYY